jgi:4-amino-4-deoxy-L-arabinose transferase-like glycosyltransferase
MQKPSALDRLVQRPRLFAAVLFACFALMAVAGALRSIDPERGGPGVTVDEFYDAAAGKRLVHALRTEGWAFFQSTNIQKNFDPLTRHPPLGRWILGWVHALFDPAPDQPESVQLVAARVAPILAFGLLVFAVACYAARSLGIAGGFVAAWSLTAIPNVYGHAHFATLDTFTALFAFLTVQTAVWALENPAQLWRFAVAGAVWGLALLTKYHGVILLAPVTLVYLWTMRRRAWLPLVIWVVVAGAVFYAGWPWLWLAPAAHVREYLASATERTQLHVFYLGQIYGDLEVPWHYPWVMLLVTLPLGLLVFAALGIRAIGSQWIHSPRWSLPAAATFTYLILFSLPGVPVYDGVRLFLAVNAWVALAIAAGAVMLYSRTAFRAPRLARWAVCLALATQGFGVFIYAPYWLSYYNLLAGGLPGAARAGFEVTYWGDTVTPRVLDPLAQAIPGQKALYLPNLAPFHAAAVALTSPALAEAGVTLVGMDQAVQGSPPAGLVVFHRRADLPDIARLFPNAELIAETSRGGVWLARSYRLPTAATSPTPAGP